jgi:hypothetical protein
LLVLIAAKNFWCCYMNDGNALRMKLLADEDKRVALHIILNLTGLSKREVSRKPVAIHGCRVAELINNAIGYSKHSLRDIDTLRAVSSSYS